MAGAAGNPLYANEMVAGLVHEGRLGAVGDGTVDVGGADMLPMPATLAEAVRLRLGALEPADRQILQVAALLGTAFSVGDLSTVLDRPATDLLAPVQAAVAAGVLTETDDQLAFRHALVRSALQDDLPTSTRRALHGQIARALAAAGAAPGRVVEHLLVAGTEGSGLLPWLREVVGDLVLSAPTAAVQLLEQTIQTAVARGRTPDVKLSMALAQALLQEGRLQEAEDTARMTVAQAAEPGEAAGSRWILALACVGQGRTDRAVEEIRRALSADGLTLAEQARFHGLAAQIHITLGNAVEADAAWRLGLNAARASDDAQALAHALGAAAGARAWDGAIEEALDYADASIAATEALGAKAGAQLAPWVHRAVCLIELGRDEEAEESLEAALRTAERGVGVDFLAWRYQIAARLRYVQGRWDEALAEVAAGLELPDRLDMARHLKAVAALIAVHRADRDAQVRLLPPLRADAPATSPGSTSWAGPTWALALAAQAEGDAPGALELLAPVWEEDPGAVDRMRYLRHYLVPDLIALTVLTGDRERSQRIAASIRRYAVVRQVPSLGFSARFANALAERDARSLLAVGDDYEKAGRVLFAAQAREAAAALLAESDDVEEGRTALNAAMEAYESLDAAWDVARAEAGLRVLGVRRGVRGPRRRPKFGWDALTETEGTVADLVAEGLSNPQIAARMFLSRRTVQGYVSSILAKLDLGSRVEIATARIRHRQDTDEPPPA